VHPDGSKPWRFAIPNPPPSIPPGTSGQDQDRLILSQGYKQSPLFQYAPNVNVLHCPADQRANSPYNPGTSTKPGSFAWGSYSGSAAMNGSPNSPDLPTTKQSGIVHPSQKYLWIEENDPRGENEGAWVMGKGGTAPTFSDAAFEDSVASWHGFDSTFSWADGHAENHRWLDGATIGYALNMDPNKYFSAPPTFAQCPHDLFFLANGYATRQNP
jgi:prepilin-type processing-associated H-X9-DG protein